jgi:hypothetical protein
MMSTQPFLTIASGLTLALAGCATSPTADPHRPFAPPPAAAVATDDDLARFRGLEGEWDADLDGDGTADTIVSFATTANGSAVIERQFRGEPYEMVSVYHLDGDRLMLTHYCAATNQPRMIAVEVEDDVIGFDLLDITNLASPEAMHIHSARIEFIDDDHVRSTWTHWANATPGEPAVFRMTRRP